MKLLIKMVFVLGVTAALSGFFLSFVHQKTLNQIEENRKKEIESAIRELISGVSSYRLKILKERKVFYVYERSGKLAGYCILTSGNGYQGEIKMLIAVTPALDRLLGVKILENVETPGLGGRITQSFFLEQFKGLKFKPRIEYVKGEKTQKENQVQAITGATISSSSVVRIINQTLSELLPNLENGK